MPIPDPCADNPYGPGCPFSPALNPPSGNIFPTNPNDPRCLQFPGIAQCKGGPYDNSPAGAGAVD
jgi:hypothetical protein